MNREVVNYSNEKWLGQKFGSLTVIEPVEHIERTRGYRCWYWKCRCDCGNTVVKIPYSVINGQWPSCGCKRIYKNEKYSNPDWIGKKFGKLSVLEIVRDRDSSGNSRIMWKMRCDCGNEIIIAPSKVTTSGQKSCICSKSESARKNSTIHGESHTRLFSIWVNMRDRCNNPKNKRYHRYGGRGISVCEEWNSDYKPFADWSRSNGYSDELTIDRIDVNGDYCPDNCRWVDMKTQQRNRSDNRLVGINGETKTLAEWCEQYGTSYSMVFNRIVNMGWEPERAIKTPSGGLGANQVTFHPELAKKEVERKYHIVNRYVDVDGEKLSLRAACEKMGIPYKAVHLRITRYGMTVEEAISKPFKDNSQSLHRKCVEHGMPYQTVVARIKSGWSEERALTEPVRKTRQKESEIRWTDDNE